MAIPHCNFNTFRIRKTKAGVAGTNRCLSSVPYSFWLKSTTSLLTGFIDTGGTTYIEATPTNVTDTSRLMTLTIH